MTVQFLETGRKVPTVDTLAKIAEGLKCHSTELHAEAQRRLMLETETFTRVG